MRFAQTLLPLVLLVSGCMFEAPIADEPSRKVDPNVLGVWLGADGETRITVSASDDFHYHIHFEPRYDETVSMPPMAFKGHHTAIHGIDVVNLKLTTVDAKDAKELAQRPWLFCTVEVVDESTVHVRLINDKFVFRNGGQPSKPLNTPAGIRDYFSRGITQPGFFHTKALRLDRLADAA